MADRFFLCIESLLYESFVSRFGGSPLCGEHVGQLPSGYHPRFLSLTLSGTEVAGRRAERQAVRHYEILADSASDPPHRVNFPAN